MYLIWTRVCTWNFDVSKGVLSNLTVLLCKIIPQFNFLKIDLNARLKYVLLDYKHIMKCVTCWFFSSYWYMYNVSQFSFYIKKNLFRTTKLQTCKCISSKIKKKYNCKNFLKRGGGVTTTQNRLKVLVRCELSLIYFAL